MRASSFFFLFSLAMFSLSPATANTDGLEAKAEAFIETMADRAVQSLTVPDISRADRVDRFRKLLDDHFMVEATGRWVLGRHWNQATESEQAEYLSLFEDLMVASYIDRFASYSGESLQVQKSLAQDDNVTVFSHIVREEGQDPVRVDWRLGGGDDGFKVVDVVVEGASMSATLRSEFASIIRQRGGKVAGLLEAMREKTAKLLQEASRE